MQIVRKENQNKEKALLEVLQQLNASINEVFYSIEDNFDNFIVTAVTKYELKEFIKDYLISLAHFMNTKFVLEIKETEVGFNVEIITDDNAIIIGKDGKNLSSIQFLLRETLKNITNIDIKVNLDVAGYKWQKEKQLKEEIKKIAKEVLATKLPAKLDSMNSYDRRIVHNIISEYPNLVTESKGETPDRYVVIKYKKD